MLDKIKVFNSEEVQTNTDVTHIQASLDDRGYGQGKDLAYFAISHSARRTLPYGIWKCFDGRHVVFNREYQPIAQLKDGECSYIDRNAWIDNQTMESTTYLYDDETSPVRYLTKHLGHDRLTASETKACKKALLICMQVLKNYTPEEHDSVSRRFSIVRE